MSKILARRMGLPAASSNAVRVERDLAAPMADGVHLLADCWFPTAVTNETPIVVMRTPYGRAGAMGIMGRLFAERGYSTVVQSCRGTFGSGGSWVPFFHERSDGSSTFAWLEQQPWFTGNVGTFGI